MWTLKAKASQAQFAKGSNLALSKEIAGATLNSLGPFKFIYSNY